MASYKQHPLYGWMDINMHKRVPNQRQYHKNVEKSNFSVYSRCHEGIEADDFLNLKIDKTQQFRKNLWNFWLIWRKTHAIYFVTGPVF